jgi:alanine-synthesizing transaminase
LTSHEKILSGQPAGSKKVRYEIRGALARRARELDQQGHDILQLNIGNPGAFGLRTPETMRRAVVRNLKYSEAYGPQTGIFPAREAVAMQFQSRGLTETRYDQVVIGNGVSELVDLVLRSLLENDEEVLVPAPDYPLWTAAVVLERRKGAALPLSGRGRLFARYRGNSRADQSPKPGRWS